MKAKRIIAALLAALTLIFPASGANTSHRTRSTELAPGVSLTEGVFQMEDRQEEHYITYSPGGAVTPLVFCGSQLTDKLAFPEASALVEGRGRRVVAGVNGDYYVMATNVPLGLVIEDGKLLSSDDGNCALGFMEDGSAFFGKPALRMSLGIGGERYRLGGLNKSIKSGDFYLYTEDFGARTGSSVKTRNIVLTVAEGQRLEVGCCLELTVESNYRSGGAVEIPENRLVLCLTESSDAWRHSGADALQPGTTLTLEISVEDLRWEQASQAMGSLYKLMSDGEIAANLDRIDRNRAPRTAVGIRKDGTVIFYTVDGRQSGYSSGLTLAETAQRLKELGCVEAGAMDGGGSTFLRAQYPGEEDCGLLSRPSLGQEREVSTFLLLTAPGKKAGNAALLSLHTEAMAVLSGSRVQIFAGACDEAGAPVTLKNIRYSVNAGSINESGVFTAPEKGGEVTIRAEVGGLEASLPLQVVESPDTLRILNQQSGHEISTLQLSPGQKVDLSSSATWQLLDVWGEDEAYSWSSSGNAGSVDESGLFTASGSGGLGTVTLQAGEQSFTVDVVVKSPIMCVNDFDNAETGAGEGIVWTAETSMDYVRYGSGSLKLSYDLSAGSAYYPMDLQWASVSDYATFWVYGDGSGTKLYSVHDGVWNLVDTLDFKGWKQLSLFTREYGGIEGLQLEGSAAGTIWLDQLLLTDYADPDLEPPVVRLHTEGALISGSLSDLVDGGLKPENITLLVDGEELPFSYDPVTGSLQALAEESPKLRRATLRASDLSGNRICVSAALEGESSGVFADLDGHWSEPYANYLYGLDVISGKPGPEDTLYFDPDSPISRAEFAVMLCRWLKVDTESYQEITVEFTDEWDIPAWAAPAARAAATLGLIKGEGSAEGVAFKPASTLTRAQAATILGRTQEGGQMCADLAFTDARDIPAWAGRYVAELVFRGVLSGYEDGYFLPNGTLTRAQAAKILCEMT